METLNFIKGSEPRDFDKLKAKILRNMNELMDDISSASISQEDALKIFDQQFMAAKRTFSALCENQPMEFDAKRHVNNNQNTIRQHHFFSTKRKQKKLKVRLAKPTEEEKLKFKEDADTYNFGQSVEIKDMNKTDSKVIPEPEGKKGADSGKVSLPVKEREILKLFGIEKNFLDKRIDENFVLGDEYPVPEILNVDSCDLNTIQKLFTPKAWVKVLEAVLKVRQLWWCPNAKGVNMPIWVLCDECDTWYHWECVSVLPNVPGPCDTWSCRTCKKRPRRE